MFVMPPMIFVTEYKHHSVFRHKLLTRIASRQKLIASHCKDENGETFIVEMQKAKIKFFKDRTLFYITLPIRTQAQKGTWYFELESI